MADRTTRRLVAIVAADVASYSRLIGLDEEGTLKSLREIRHEVVAPLLDEHGGRIANTAGDSLLLEFSSVVDAVRCALAMQQEVAARNARIPEERRLVFRLGINLGDVVSEGADLLGDGVNVAARLESLAEPGGIALSDDAYRQVRDRIDVVWDDAGERELKNIARPVRVWHWSSQPSEAKEHAAVTPSFHPALPDKPSIAVLPFDNMSGDPEQEYFADGITEDILTALSRFRSLFVIARNSSFTYKGKAVGIQQVGRELGVRYVLEGSVRRGGDRVRITVQLIDAMTGTNRWAERYDREVQDVFAVQDEVTQSIVNMLVLVVDREEVERTQRKRPEHLDAYDCYIRGRAAARSATRGQRNRGQALAEARQLLERALAIDPAYAPALAWLAFNYWSTYAEPSHHGQLDSEFLNPGILEKALTLARSAVDCDPALAEAHSTLGWILMWKRRPTDALAACQRAMELNPNAVAMPYGLGHVYSFAGRPADAVHEIQRAMRLDPFYAPPLLAHLGRARYMLHQYAEAVEALEACVARSPDFRIAHIWLAAAYAQLSRLDEARSSAAEVLRLQPDFTISGWVPYTPHPNAEDAGHLTQGLRMAGLPE